MRHLKTIEGQMMTRIFISTPSLRFPGGVERTKKVFPGSKETGSAIDV
jgi:hypothetical protein